jgi:hypothetical protein
MPVAKRRSPESGTTSKKAGFRLDILLADLNLFMSLWLARLIIKRVLRTRRKERATRLRNLRLINGGGQVPANDKALPAIGMDENGILRETTQSVAVMRRG